MSKALHTLPFISVISASLLLSACGGGGGSSSNKDPEQPAPPVTSNLASPTPNASLAPIHHNTYKIAYTTENIIKFAQLWSDPLLTSASFGSNSNRATNSRNVVTEPTSTDCPFGGTARQEVSGDNNTNTVTRTITYLDCKDAAATANGMVKMTSTLGQLGNNLYIPAQVATFQDFNLASEEENLTLNGEARYQTNSQDKTFTLNLSIQDNLTGQEIKASDIRITAPFASLLVDHFYRFSITGKMHFADEGILDFNKTDRASSKLHIQGKNGTSLTLAAVNIDAGLKQAMRRITADTDGDGIADRHALIPWLLYYPKGENTASPVAVITPADPVTQVGTPLELSGANSTDENYTPLAFHWQLSAADAQQATLTPTNGVTTQFKATKPGTYEVTLTASDGSHSHNEVVYVTVQ